MEGFRNFGPIHTLGMVIGCLVYFAIFPFFALFGGATDLLHWGPGFIASGIAGLLLIFSGRRPGSVGSDLHGWLWFFLLSLLLWQASISPGVAFSSIASDGSLIALAGMAYIIGKAAGPRLAQALFVGLAATVFLNLACILVQLADPDWNFIYSNRSGTFPSGLFAHYNYSASFCLGALGLLVSRSLKECGCLKWLMIVGAFCALISLPLTLSRGGNFALAAMVIISIALLIGRGLRSSKSLLSIWLPMLLILPAIVIAVGYLIPTLNRGQESGDFYQDGGRVGFWRAAVQLASENPWIGSGADSFRLNVYRVMENLGAEPDKVHNEALQLAVDYGYLSLLAMILLILVPVVVSISRFLVGRDPEKTVWESVGLIGMLVQSNFSFIFHLGPGVFLAGIILGRISYGSGSSDKALSKNNRRMQGENPASYKNFLIVAKGHTQDYFAGKLVAASNLASLCVGRDEPWDDYRARILFHSKTNNWPRLDNVVKDVKAECVDQLLELVASSENVLRPTFGSITKRVFIGGAAACVLWVGVNLTQALSEAWPVNYGRGDQLSNWQRFEKTIALKEKYPYAPVERKVLSIALDCIYQFDTAAAREYWAEGNVLRIKNATSGASSDPLVALQLACILGWAGDVDGAFALYDRAILAQGNNETLFMAHAFQAQYYYELSQAAAAAGEDEDRVNFAESAVASFLRCQDALKTAPWKFSAQFSEALAECRLLAEK